mmetsp:Transcript_37014/g.89956  ORF Transcript_37014/g.89956 Transcript_37014/m.89956 type:complete len:229 (-) Transcript_37014:545-1231(-)
MQITNGWAIGVLHFVSSFLDLLSLCLLAPSFPDLLNKALLDDGVVLSTSFPGLLNKALVGGVVFSASFPGLLNRALVGGVVFGASFPSLLNMALVDGVVITALILLANNIVCNKITRWAKWVLRLVCETKWLDLLLACGDFMIRYRKQFDVMNRCNSVHIDRGRDLRDHVVLNFFPGDIKLKRRIIFDAGIWGHSGREEFLCTRIFTRNKINLIHRGKTVSDRSKVVA